MDFVSANSLLQGRCKSTRNLTGKATRLERRESSGDIAVRYHETDVVTFKPNGDTVFNSGGWRTMTTKDRMNTYGNARISQREGVWYIHGGHPRISNVYRDGVIVRANGLIENAETNQHAKRQIKLAIAINTYCREYMDALFAHNVPAPSSGDCWPCCMKRTDGKTWGEFSGPEHLSSHMRDRYYVPSLLLRATEVFKPCDAARGILGDLWKLSDNFKGNFGSYESIARRDLSSSLRRYMRRMMALSDR